MKLKVLIKGILAGMLVSIGGWLYLKANTVASPIIGPFLFSTGLILIYNFDFYLYTGKICYLFENKSETYKKKISDLLIGVLGNLIGALIMGLTLRLVLKGSNDQLFINLSSSVSKKINYEWYQMIILGFFCGMFLYFAVEGFKTIDNVLGKYIVLMLCIAGFIIAGFEHSIANMFYFSLNNTFSLSSFFLLFLCFIGNTLGGLFIPTVRSYLEKK